MKHHLTLAVVLLPLLSIGAAAQQSRDDSVRTLPAVTVRGTAEPAGYAVGSSAAATRTDTPLREIPQSIQIVPRRLIDDQQAVTVTETLLNVSGVVPNNALSTPAFETTRIRGFRAEHLVDGFTQYYNAGDREGTVGIERIEVLKGANAVLYGGGSGSPVGGVVNVVSRLPRPGAFGELGVKGGSNSFGQVYFDANQPLGGNVLLRVSGEKTSAKSDIDVVDQDRYNINPAITLTNNSTTSLTMQGKVSRWKQQEYQGLPAVGTIAGDFRLRRETFIGPASIPDSRAEFDGIWATLDHRLDDIWSFSVKARYAQSEFDEKVQTLFGADGFQANRPFAAPSSWFLANAELFQEQQERSVLANAVAKFSLGPTRNTLLLGADYSRLEDEGFIDFVTSGFVDFAAPVFDTPYADPGPGINNQFVKNTIHGIYAQLQSTIHDRLHLLAGVRRAHVGIDFVNATAFGGAASTSENRWLPRLGAVLDLGSNVSIFANYAEGLRGQPFALFVSAPEPERSKSIEGGLKAEFPDRLSAQIAAYEIERSNVAVADPSGLTFSSVAAGKQRSRGVEADLTWQPARGLSLLASYAHTDAEFSDGLFGVPAGNTLPGVPRHSGRLWAHYRFGPDDVRGWNVGAGAYWQSGAYVANDNAFKADAYHSFDASIGYEARHFKLGLSVKNLTDEKYYETYEYFGGRVAPGAGRAAYLSLALRY